MMASLMLPNSGPRADAEAIADFAGDEAEELYFCRAEWRDGGFI